MINAMYTSFLSLVVPLKPNNNFMHPYFHGIIFKYTYVNG